MKTAGNKIDKEKYTKIVAEVVGSFKTDLTAAKGSVAKMTHYLEKDWIKVKKVVG